MSAVPPNLQEILDGVPRFLAKGRKSQLERLAQALGQAGIADMQRRLALSGPEILLLCRHPRFSLRPSQRFPLSEPGWKTLFVSAGRGFGKSHAASCAALEEAERDPSARIALVAPNLPMAKATNIWGPSGILALAPPWFTPEVFKGDRKLVFPNGAELTWVSASNPDKIRGGNFSLIIADELVAWDANTACEALDECYRTLRLVTPDLRRRGLGARLIITTTPRPSAVFAHLLETQAGLGLRMLTGSTFENARNLDKSYLAYVRRQFHTATGQIEFAGKLSFADLGLRPTFSEWDIDATRIEEPRERYTLIEVSWDPASGEAKGPDKRRDKHGVVVVGYYKDEEGVTLADVLVSEEYDVKDHQPSDVAKRCVELSRGWEPHADRSVVAVEINAAGSFARSTIRSHDKRIRIRTYRSKSSKQQRTEAVAPLGAAGMIHILGRQPILERQIKRFAGNGTTAKGSDDAVDAMCLTMVKHLVKRAVGALADGGESEEDAEAAAA